MTNNPNPAVVGRGSSEGEPADAQHELLLEVDEFAWEALEDEAREMGVSIEELASFAVLYYLADHDSGRTARELPEQAVENGRRTLAQLRAR